MTDHRCMTRAERFWRRVRAIAEGRVRDHYMRRCKHDRRCPNCGTWGALGAGFDWSKLRPVDGAPWQETLPCLQCGYVSTWDCAGMIPTIAEGEIKRHGKPFWIELTGRA